MKVSEALYSRHACRAFLPEPIDNKTLLKILDAANHSPSWANTQPWDIYVAGGEKLENLRQAYNEALKNKVPANPDIPAPKSWPDRMQRHMAELFEPRLKALKIDPEDKEARQKMFARNFHFFGAPAVIFLCMDKTLTQWSLFDLGAVSHAIMLETHELGLATVPAFWIASYPDIVRKELSIPDSLSVVIGIAIGRADDKDALNKVVSSRRPIEEVVTFRGL
jgi:nitroreductase